MTEGSKDKLPIHMLTTIPEGGRLEAYMKEVPVVAKTSEAIPFLQRVFRNCLDFVSLNADAPLPSMLLILVLSPEQFSREVERESRIAVEREEARRPEMTRGFHVGTRVYVNLRFHTDLLAHGELSFIMALVETYMHEIAHIAFPDKSEQETFEKQGSLIESFFGIELPVSVKTQKASDYYVPRF